MLLHVRLYRFSMYIARPQLAYTRCGDMNDVLDPESEKWASTQLRPDQKPNNELVLCDAAECWGGACFGTCFSSHDSLRQKI